ncbi:sugar phosphate isomerase/epimerase [Poseidonocella sp. HB161398]|uniref:sugar phosphate isomerase/epimerase family protein n=1 Tax=Poseidonocella sp. HB161398 TaxID=2320855 RepID=UPI001F10AE96|nr:sugar phosphate isomerase/epimerase [Poseidonocella sp. HB161398]
MTVKGSKMSLDHVLSFQLYTSRDGGPLEAQLAALAALGVTNVEPYGDLYADPAALRAQLDAAGLTALSGHFDLEMLEAEPDRAIAAARVLGMEIVIAPWLEPEDRPADAAGWQALGARLAAVHARLAAAGLAFGWHNHDFEFTALPDGSFPIEHLMAAGDFGLELDVAWVRRAGQDPLEWIGRYADRLLAFHVKDVAPEGENLDEDGWAVVGQGIVDWPAAWARLGATGARVAMLEHDEPKDWLDFAAKSSAAVRQLAAA